MQPADKPVKAILVGVGQRGKHWAHALHNEADACTVAYVDVSEENLAWAAEEFSPPKEALFREFRQALDTVEADAVILVTPPMVRYEQSLQTIERGLPILAEKPLTMDFPSTLEVTRRAAERGVPLVSGFNFRHLSVTQATKRLLDSGELGKPSFARIFLYWHRTGTRPGGNRYPLTMEHPMVLEQSVHALDLIRYVYGSEVKSLHAITHNPPWSPYVGDATATALLEMDNGMLINYLGTWMGQSLVREYDWRTDCTKGTIFQRSMFSDLFVARAGSDVLEPVPLDEGQPFRDDTRKLLRAFVEDLAAGVEPQPGGAENLKTMALTCAVIESAQVRKRVDMADFYRRHGVAPQELLG
jgi:predicted dehydrogenase